MANLILCLIILGIIGSIIWYLYRAKKRGETCIGCPYAKQCGGHCHGTCNHTDSELPEIHK